MIDIDSFFQFYLIKYIVLPNYANLLETIYFFNFIFKLYITVLETI